MNEWNAKVSSSKSFRRLPCVEAWHDLRVGSWMKLNCWLREFFAIEHLYINRSRTSFIRNFIFFNLLNPIIWPVRYLSFCLSLRFVFLCKFLHTDSHCCWDFYYILNTLLSHIFIISFFPSLLIQKSWKSKEKSATAENSYWIKWLTIYKNRTNFFSVPSLSVRHETKNFEKVLKIFSLFRHIHF